jgi:GT2 family glycosyltransferase
MAHARRYWTKRRRCTRILDMWLSAIIPTYQEACGIADAVAAAGTVADEVIVVDSGSDDGTAEIAGRGRG